MPVRASIGIGDRRPLHLQRVIESKDWVGIADVTAKPAAAESAGKTAESATPIVPYHAVFKSAG